MASTASTTGPQQEDSRPFYCHHCSHQWMKTASSHFECPQCGQGFIEEVTADFRPNQSERFPVELIPSSPLINLVFYQSEMDGDQDPANNTRRRLPRQTARSRRSARQQASRSRSPHVSIVVQSNNGNAFRFGFNRDDRVASPNRFLSVSINDIMDSLFAPGFNSNSPAMTDEQLQEIPKITISEEQVRNDLMCSVCFDDFQLNENEVRKLQCDHIFHEKCIFPWLKTNASCPVCRTEILNETHQEEDNDDESFNSIIRFFSEYSRQRFHEMNGGVGTSAMPAAARSNRHNRSPSSSGESNAIENNQERPSRSARSTRYPTIRVSPHPIDRIRRRPNSENTTMNSLLQLTTRPRRPGPRPSSIVRSRNRTASLPIEEPINHAYSRPSQASPSDSMQNSSSPPSTFAASTYRPAREARLIARSRIAEITNRTRPTRGMTTANAASGLFSSLRNGRRRNSPIVGSSFEPQTSSNSRPNRAARMNSFVSELHSPTLSPVRPSPLSVSSENSAISYVTTSSSSSEEMNEESTRQNRRTQRRRRQLNASYRENDQ